MKSSGILVLAILLAGTAFAQPKRDWQDGTWRDSERIASLAGVVANGSVVGNSATATAVPVHRVYQEFVIETPDRFLFAEQRLRFRWSKAVPMTVNASVKYALEKDKIYVVGEDGKEYELSVTKKVLKTADR